MRINGYFSILRFYYLLIFKIDIIKGMEKNQSILRILHFNDVYDIQPNLKKNTAGAYYFKAYLDKYRNQNTITLFSGDAFSPSVLSNIFRGQQMVHCLNQFGIDVSCYGNHQFDYDIDFTINLAKQCNFPWLLGNLIDLRTERPLGNGRQNVIIDKNGIKIGIFGVAEQQWLTLLTEDYQGQLEYVDFVKYSRYQVKELRTIYKCDLIVALTHMRVPNDQKLALEVPDIDLILGGHDHTLYNQKIGKTHIIKSGTNFQNLNVIDLFYDINDAKSKNKNFKITTQLLTISEVQDYNQQLKDYVDKQLSVYEKQNQKIIGHTLVPLETRFSKIRRKQTNYGDFLTDLIKAFYNIDAVTLQAGSIRIDSLLEPGPLKYSTISNVFDDFLIVKFLPGKILYDLLEHAVSKYPAFQGRFMMVSGIRYTFDAALPPYSRVLKQSIRVGGQPLDYNKIYKVAMTDYIGKGGDGYTFLAECKDYIDSETGVTLTCLMTKFYRPADLNPSLSCNIPAQSVVLTMKQRRSSSSQRIHKLIRKIQYIDGAYIVYIEPTVDGRINILNEVPDIQ